MDISNPAYRDYLYFTLFVRSPLKKTRIIPDREEPLLPGNDTSAIAQYVRTPLFQYGWDWAPRLVDMGLQEAPYLIVWDTIRIREVQITQDEVRENWARLRFRTWVDVVTEGRYTLQLIHEGEVVSEYTKIWANGRRYVDLNWNTAQPKLWWPNGSGEPHLYDFTIRMVDGDRVLSETKVRTGLRTVELVREQDEIGESFYFKVNGKPIFMKGANYVPQDVLLSRVKPEQYRALIADAKACNMNMLRVWGGGTYERELFYDLCDEAGILVWQDFMFACSMYPGSERFLQNVEEEARAQIRRLRNHPCMALWCGNNESRVAWFNWGWQDQHGIHGEDSIRIYNDYLRLFDTLLPRIVREESAGVDYLSTSPLSNWGAPERFDSGDNHYWGVWHGTDRFEDYARYVPRFMSEYGFQSCPDSSFLAEYIPPEHLNVGDPVFEARQKSYKGTGHLLSYLKEYYPEPRTFGEFVVQSQLAQALAMRIAIESHRLSDGRCMGSLYWQFNDAWPGLSWSTRDYAGGWKVAQHKVRDLYAPVLIGQALENEKPEWFCLNEGGQQPVRLIVEHIPYSGEPIDSFESSFRLDPGRHSIHSMIREPNKWKHHALRITIRTAQNELLASRWEFGLAARDLNLPEGGAYLEVLKSGPEMMKVRLHALMLLRDVVIAGPAGMRLPDNGFHLAAGEHFDFYVPATSLDVVKIFAAGRQLRIRP